MFKCLPDTNVFNHELFIAEQREFIDTSKPLILGGFGAFGNPSSFHHPEVFWKDRVTEFCSNLKPPCAKRIMPSLRNESVFVKSTRPVETERSYMDVYSTEKITALVDKCVVDVTDTPDGTGTGKLHVNPPIKVFGKPGIQRRSVAFFGVTKPDGTPEIEGYRYSGQLAAAQPMPVHLGTLLNLVNEFFGSEYNGVLVNRYMTGEDTIGDHSDDEKFLDATGVVAISWGQSRTFRIRTKGDKKIIADIPTGSHMLIMAGDFQKEFTHGIPVEKKKNGVRLSFTFRKHLKLQ
jgi:hypothetical protein